MKQRMISGLKRISGLQVPRSLVGWIAAIHQAHVQFFEHAAMDLRAGENIWGKIADSVRRKMQQVLDDSRFPDDVQNDIVTRDKR